MRRDSGNHESPASVRCNSGYAPASKTIRACWTWMLKSAQAVLIRQHRTATAALRYVRYIRHRDSVTDRYPAVSIEPGQITVCQHPATTRTTRATQSHPYLPLSLRLLMEPLIESGASRLW